MVGKVIVIVGGASDGIEATKIQLLPYTLQTYMLYGGTAPVVVLIVI
jgi:hypothetical protein